MKKLLSTLVLATLVLAAGFAQDKKNIDVDDFTSVSFGVSGDLILQQGTSFKVVVEGDEELLDAIEIDVRDNRLVIRKPNWRKARNKRLTAWVTMPEIEGASVAGSGDISNKGSLECDNLKLRVSGSGQIEIDNLSADDIDIGISGSGSISLDGEGADMVNISISGSGGVNAENFRVDRIDVGISGSGKCRVWAEESIRARISGSGNIYYKGEPNIDSKSSGSGSIRKF